MARASIAAAAGIVIGIAIGLSAGMFSGSPEATAVADSGRIREPVVNADLEHREIDAPSGIESSAARDTADAAQSPSRSEIASERTSTELTTDGVITGRVLDADAKGVPDVAVRAAAATDQEEATPSKRGRGLEPMRSLEDEIELARAAYRRKMKGCVETVTDANGQYTLKGVSSGRSYVTAARDGFIVEAQGSSSVRAGGSVDFTATGVVTLPIEVLLPDGRSASRVNLSIQTNRNSTSDLWSSELPRILTKPGSCKVRAELVAAQLAANGVADEAVSQWTSVDIAPDHTDKITLKLEMRCGIRGKLLPHPEIVTSQSFPIQRIALAAGADFDPSKPMNNENGSSWASSNGSFEFLDLKPGRYAVAVSSRWGNSPPLVYEVIEVPQGIANVTLDLSKLDTSKFILTTVIDQSGRMVRDVNFNAMLKSANGSTSGGDLLTALVRRDAKYWLAPGGDAADFLAGRKGESSLDLTATTDATGPKTVPVTPGTKTLDIKFGKPAFLEVSVSNYVGSGFETRLSVSLRKSSESRTYGGGGFGRDNATDQGKFKIGPVEPGEYTLRMSGSAKSSNYYESINLAEQPIALAEGTNQVTIAIPQLTKLTVAVTGAKEGSVRLDNKQRSNSKSSEIANGVAVFESLVAGEYRVSYSDGSLIADAVVHVPETTNVTLRPSEPNALAVSIRDAAGDLAKAGFHDGDVILGAGGKAFQAGEASDAYGTFGKAKAKLLVLRDGQTIELEVGVTKGLRGGKSAGGDVRLVVR